MSADSGQSLLQGLSPEQLLRMNSRAGEWHVRQQQTNWSHADEQALNEWLTQNAAHREALQRVRHTWHEAQLLKSMFPATYDQSRTAPIPTPASEREQPAVLPMAVQRPVAAVQQWWRRPALSTVFATALVALVTTGYGWYRWDNTASYALDVATTLGELRDIDLPDGSHVALNANSRLQVRYYPRRRETVLEQGEAFFKVTADARKPFTVDSGDSQVRVVGTAFNVRAGPPEVVVQVEEGRVEVRSKTHSKAATLVLGPGIGIALDPANGQHRSVPVVVESVAEWRSGQIYFKRAPLSQVATELARYLGQPVAIDGAAIQNVPVSGLLALKDPEQFLLALPSVAQVRVMPRAGGGWLISPR